MFLAGKLAHIICQPVKGLVSGESLYVLNLCSSCRQRWCDPSINQLPDLHPYVTSETLQELGLVEYKVDTFSSDYDDFVDEFGIELDAHGA